MKKCPSCKADNPDTSNFCRKCGKSLAKDSNKKKLKSITNIKNKRLIIAGTALALAIAGGVSFAVYDNTPERRYQKNIAMAERYINNCEFSKAEEYLNIAKSIDPKKQEAYEKLVTTYKATGELDKANNVVAEAKQTLPAQQQQSFLNQLEEITKRAEQLAILSIEKEKEIASSTSTSQKKPTSTQSKSDQRETPGSSNNKPSSKDPSSTPSIENGSTPVNSSTQSSTVSSSQSVLDSLERPQVDNKDLDDESSVVPHVHSDEHEESSSEKESSIDEIRKSSIKNESPEPTPVDQTKTEKALINIEPINNTSYTLLSEIGQLEMAPIVLNNDCWVIKKDGTFQFLFPDGTTKKMDDEDHLALQMNLGTSSVSSACLTESSSSLHTQYYPVEEKETSCLANNNEKAAYSLEGNYKNVTVPVLVKSANQTGVHWIYNPATQQLYGPLKDGQNTSFYSKINQIPQVTLIGHNGQIGGPYWTTGLVEEDKESQDTSTKIGLEPSSKEKEDNISASKALQESQGTTDEIRIWSKDGKSYTNQYTKPVVSDWYTIGAFRGSQFNLLDENLKVVYAGSFDQGGSVIDGVAPVYVNGTWKLVDFGGIPSSGPNAGYAFTNTSKDEEKKDDKEETTESTTEENSVQENKNDKSDQKTKKDDSTSSTDKSETSDTSSQDESDTSSNTTSDQKSENSTSSIEKSENNSSSSQDKSESSSSKSDQKEEDKTSTSSTGKSENSLTSSQEKSETSSVSQSDQKVDSKTSSTQSTSDAEDKSSKDEELAQKSETSSSSITKDATKATNDKAKVKEDSKSESSSHPTNYFLNDSEDTKEDKKSSSVVKEDKSTSSDSSVKTAETKKSGTKNYFEDPKNSSSESKVNNEKENKIETPTTSSDKKNTEPPKDTPTKKETPSAKDTSSTKDKISSESGKTNSTSKKSSSSIPTISSPTISSDEDGDEYPGTNKSNSTLVNPPVLDDPVPSKETSSEKEKEEPIYYSFPQFAGVYTVKGPSWSNSFKLHSDGTFEGEYVETSPSDDLEEYPEGINSTCSYSGTFSVKENHLRITSISLEETPREIGVEAGMLYQYVGLADSCMAQGDTFTLYGPGTPYSTFSAKASQWLPALGVSETIDFIMVQDGSELAYS